MFVRLWSQIPSRSYSPSLFTCNLFTWFLVGTLGMTLTTVPSNCSMLISSKMTVPWGSSLTSVATSLPYVTRKIHANIIYTSGWSVKTYTLKHWSKADQSRVQDTKVLLDAYISVFDGELHVISSLQSFQITFELAVVKEDLLHHISPLNESKRLLKDNTSFSITAMVSIIQNVSSSACLKSTVSYFME